jgi:hypothetical protein
MPREGFLTLPPDSDRNGRRFYLLPARSGAILMALMAISLLLDLALLATVVGMPRLKPGVEARF